MKTLLNFTAIFPNGRHNGEHIRDIQMENALETHMLRGLLWEQTMFNAHSQSNK